MKVALSCPTLCDPRDCSPTSVHGISQARILKWVAIPFSRGSSQPRSLTEVSCIAGRFFTTRTTWGAHLVPQSGIKPTSPAVEAWILHPWAARKVPLSSSYKDPGHCAEDPSRGCPSPPPQVSHLLPAAVPVCFGDESGPPLALWPLSACLASSPSAHTWCPCCIAGQGCHNLCAFADSVPSA